MDTLENMTMMNEKFLTLTGQWHSDILWSAKGRWPLEGHPASVDFSQIYDRVISREQQCGDVIGFYHTHPSFPASPSSVDVSTMNQWVDCLGKSLLCLIHGVDGLKTYYWQKDYSYLTGVSLKAKNKFIGGIINE